jgi:hypothetical protein
MNPFAFLDPSMLDTGKQKFNSMSDEELRRFIQMNGLGNIDPSFLRQTMGGMFNKNDGSSFKKPP